MRERERKVRGAEGKERRGRRRKQRVLGEGKRRRWGVREGEPDNGRKVEARRGEEKMRRSD